MVIEVFGQCNFQNLIISENAQRAGVHEGAVCQCFKNKEAFFFSVPAEKRKEFCSQPEMGVRRSFTKKKTYAFLKTSANEILRIVEEEQDETAIKKKMGTSMLSGS